MAIKLKKSAPTRTERYSFKVKPGTDQALTDLKKRVIKSGYVWDFEDRLNRWVEHYINEVQAMLDLENPAPKA